MFALAHLKKYLKDHPQHFQGRESKILEAATKLADDSGILSSGIAGELLSEHSGEFFTLMSSDLDYLKISAEAVAQMPRPVFDKPPNSVPAEVILRFVD